MSDDAWNDEELVRATFTLMGGPDIAKYFSVWLVTIWQERELVGPYAGKVVMNAIEPNRCQRVLPLSGHRDAAGRYQVTQALDFIGSSEEDILSHNPRALEFTITPTSDESCQVVACCTELTWIATLCRFLLYIKDIYRDKMHWQGLSTADTRYLYPIRDPYSMTIFQLEVNAFENIIKRIGGDNATVVGA